MKCPHCEYEHGYGAGIDEWRDVKGNEGDFYESPIEMQRKSEYGNYVVTSNLYGCPSCKKTFID